MNNNQATPQHEIYVGALAIKAHADAILDRTHCNPDIPEEYGYALLAVGGWLHHESNQPNSNTHTYALAVVRSFIYGPAAIL